MSATLAISAMALGFPAGVLLGVATDGDMIGPHRALASGGFLIVIVVAVLMLMGVLS